MADVGDISNRSDRGPFGSTSTGLLAGIKARDEAAWSRMAQLYYPLVWSWCVRAGLQPHDAADVIQEVFRAVAAGIESFRRDRPTDRFRGWLWGIARHKIVDFRRRQPADRAAGGSEALERLRDVPEADDDSSDGIVSEQTAALARRALELLQTEFEPTTWQAFWHVVVDGKLPAEVAAELGISVNAVYKAKSRVLHRLRQELLDAD